MTTNFSTVFINIFDCDVDLLNFVGLHITKFHFTWDNSHSFTISLHSYFYKNTIFYCSNMIIQQYVQLFDLIKNFTCGRSHIVSLLRSLYAVAKECYFLKALRQKLLTYRQIKLNSNYFKYINVHIILLRSRL